MSENETPFFPGSTGPTPPQSETPEKPIFMPGSTVPVIGKPPILSLIEWVFGRKP